MLLQSLLASDPDSTGTDATYAERVVRWVIDLDEKGNPVSPGLVDLADPAQKDLLKGRQMRTPNAVRTSGDAAIVAVDKLDYLLGTPSSTEPKARENARRRHQVAVDLHHRLAATITPSPLDAVDRFLTTTPRLGVPDGAVAGDWAAFRVGGHYVHDHPKVQAAWAKEVLSRKTSGAAGRCLVCGTVGPLADTFPAQLPLKSVPGQQQQLALVSINKRSQGRDGTIGLANTPVCFSCANRSVAALTRLLHQQDSHQRLGDDRVIAWWTTDKPRFDPFSLTPNTPAALNAALSSIHTYRRDHPHVDTARFHAVIAGANASRLVVHRWVDRTLDEVLTALEHWFEDTTVTSPRDGPRVFPVRLLAAATGRRDQQRYAGPAHGAEPAITLAALEGGAPPVALVSVVCSRVRADGQLTDERAALLRVLLRRHHLSPSEVTMPELNSEATSPAYLCGRLLAVADSLQHSAIPDLNTSVADKVLGRCSMAPGSILPRVLTGAQAHLKKLRTSGRGAAASAIADRLDTIAADLHAFPPTLTLPEQGEFLLGFLHQRHADTTARRAHSADADQKETTDV